MISQYILGTFFNLTRTVFPMNLFVGCCTWQQSIPGLQCIIDPARYPALPKPFRAFSVPISYGFNHPTLCPVASPRICWSSLLRLQEASSFLGTKDARCSYTTRRCIPDPLPNASFDILFLFLLALKSYHQSHFMDRGSCKALVLRNVLLALSGRSIQEIHLHFAFSDSAHRSSFRPFLKNQLPITRDYWALKFFSSVIRII